MLQPAADIRLFRSKGRDGSTDSLDVRNAPVLLTRPQHAPLLVKPGIWCVVRQRHYDPATGWEAAHPLHRTDTVMAIMPVPTGPMHADPRSTNAASAMDAVRGLYAACHLPAPAILVARDAVHFARLAARFQRQPGSLRAAALFFGTVVAVIAALGFAFGHGEGIWAGSVAIAMIPILRGEMRTEEGATAGLVPWCLAHVVGLVLFGAIVVWILRLLDVTGLPAFDLAGAAIGFCGVLLVLTDVVHPVWVRRRYLRQAELHGPRPRLWHIIRGAAPAGPVLLPRLEQALADVPPPAPVRPADEMDAQRAAMPAAIEAEMRRFPGYPRPRWCSAAPPPAGTTQRRASADWQKQMWTIVAFHGSCSSGSRSMELPRRSAPFTDSRCRWQSTPPRALSLSLPGQPHGGAARDGSRGGRLCKCWMTPHRGLRP